MQKLQAHRTHLYQEPSYFFPLTCSSRFNISVPQIDYTSHHYITVTHGCLTQVFCIAIDKPLLIIAFVIFKCFQFDAIHLFIRVRHRVMHLLLFTSLKVCSLMIYSLFLLSFSIFAADSFNIVLQYASIQNKMRKKCH